MSTDNLNKWLSLVANVGVVAGILLLAVEIRQNQELLDRNLELAQLDYELQVAEGLIGIADSVNEQRLLIAGNSELAQIWLDGKEGRELSAVDQSRFDELCSASIWTGATAYGRNVALGRHELAEAEVRIRQMEADSPGLRRCWEANLPFLELWGYGELTDAVASGTND